MRGEMLVTLSTFQSREKFRKTRTLPRMWMPLTVKPFLSCADIKLRLSSKALTEKGANLRRTAADRQKTDNEAIGEHVRVRKNPHTVEIICKLYIK